MIAGAIAMGFFLAEMITRMYYRIKGSVKNKAI